MDNFYPEHPSFQRLPDRPNMYNFGRNDGDYYNHNLHVIPTNMMAPVHLPYYPPPMQPNVSLQQTSPTGSRTVQYKSNRKYRSGGRRNLIEVRSTLQPLIKPLPVDSFSSSNIVQTEVLKSLDVESKSSYKSHSNVNERYSNVRTPTKPLNVLSHLESKSSSHHLDSKSLSHLSRGKLNRLRYIKPKIRERNSYYDKYYEGSRQYKRYDKYKWTNKNAEPKRHPSIKVQLNEKQIMKNVRGKPQKVDKEVLEEISDIALDDDIEEVEIVAVDDLKEKISIGFRKCKVRYLSFEQTSFFKPKVYCISPERIIVNYFNGEKSKEKDGVDDIVSEEDYEMEIVGEELTSENEIKSEKNLKGAKEKIRYIDEVGECQIL